MRARSYLVFLSCGFTLTVAAASCGPGDHCSVTQTCPTNNEGGGGAGGTSDAGGGVSDGGGGALPGELGFPCGAPSECDSGFCVDGVCCAGACDGTCEACDGSGTCAPHAPGTDPDGDCADGVCDGVGVCATGAHRWSKRFGDGGGDELTGLDARSSRIGFVGRYEGSPEFGLGPLSAPTNAHGAFGVQLDLSGVATLSLSVVDAFISVVDGAVGPDGRLLISGGGGNGEADFGGGTLSLGLGSGDGFLGAVSVNGSHVHSDTIGGYGASITRVVATASEEAVVVGRVDDSGGNLGGVTIGSGIGLFVAKLDSTGNGLWSFNEVVGSVFAEALAIQDDGDIVVVGSASGDVMFGSKVLPGSGPRLFLLRLSAAGDVLSAHAWGSATTQLLAVTSVDDDIVLGGAFSSAIDFGGPTLTAVSGDDVFVARVTEDGQHVWSARYGEGGDQSVASLGVAADGALYAAGLYNGTLSFGVGGTSSGGGFVVKIHPSGEPIWSRDLAGGVSSVHLAGLDDGGVVVGGSFTGNVDLGGGVLTSAGETDVFAAAFDP